MLNLSAILIISLTYCSADAWQYIYQSNSSQIYFESKHFVCELNQSDCYLHAYINDTDAKFDKFFSGNRSIFTIGDVFTSNCAPPQQCNQSTHATSLHTFLTFKLSPLGIGTASFTFQSSINNISEVNYEILVVESSLFVEKFFRIYLLFTYALIFFVIWYLSLSYRRKVHAIKFGPVPNFFLITEEISEICQREYGNIRI